MRNRFAKKRHAVWTAEGKTRMNIMTANVTTLEGHLPTVLGDANENETHGPILMLMERPLEE